MIEKFLKLSSRFRVATRGHERLAAHIGRLQTAEIMMSEVQAIRRHFVSESDLEPLHALCGLAQLQRGVRTENRHIGEFHESIFREALLQIPGERFRSGSVARKSQGKPGRVFDFPCVLKLEKS